MRASDRRVRVVSGTPISADRTAPWPRRSVPAPSRPVRIRPHEMRRQRRYPRKRKSRPGESERLQGRDPAPHLQRPLNQREDVSCAYCLSSCPKTTPMRGAYCRSRVWPAPTMRCRTRRSRWFWPAEPGATCFSISQAPPHRMTWAHCSAFKRIDRPGKTLLTRSVLTMLTQRTLMVRCASDRQRMTQPNHCQPSHCQSMYASLSRASSRSASRSS